MEAQRDILLEISRVTARLAAAEAVVVQITAPMLEAIEPGLSRQVIQTIRAGLTMPTADEFQRLAVEEYLQRFADSIEARVRSKIGT
ncbi:hypothetical protein XI09_40985 [Bradyrhizobium sp. CCBAU 11386]|uniref:hypothetical protein n=1 Tax=Bradyrhizobium sp. CCBAU 11386 TaxID=1630837 RepID=UPI0023047C6F|nr:hypothetical protein [Bradyrhizobium sp. CCBAU 11386]MDA9510926.1 hypothetical protein [Bradyrhizobium sp. CCBAU 11386]